MGTRLRKNMAEFKRIIPCLVFVSFALANCAQPAADAVQVTEQAEDTQQAALPASDESAVLTPTAQSLPDYSLSKQAYVSPSNAFTINLPQGWNCSEIGAYQVDCHAPDNSSMTSVRVIGTGYELLQEDFLSLVRAELVSTYEDKKAYFELSQESAEGSFIVNATWKEGDVFWQGTDHFVRSAAAVYYLTFAGVQESFENYQPLFEAMIQNAELNPSAMSGVAIYSFRKEYTSPDLIFTLRVPTSWSKYVDTASIERTIVEGFLSPDLHAAVQVAVFRKGSPISQSVKASKTLEIMHDLYGYDMRVSIDKALQDGREYLEWYAEMRGLNGITYFDSVGTSLYIFNVVWEDATKDLYKPVLDEVIASFTYKY